MVKTNDLSSRITKLKGSPRYLLTMGKLFCGENTKVSLMGYWMFSNRVKCLLLEWKAGNRTVRATFSCTKTTKSFV